MNHFRTLLSLILRIQALIFAQALIAVPVLAGELTVRVGTVEGTSGQVMVAILDGEAAFNGEAPAVLSVLLPPRPGTLAFSTDALVDGAYGIRVMHDENGNGDMDSNMVGAPKEPWGFSNNAVGNFGPPSWSDVRFELKGDTEISIDLNH